MPKAVIKQISVGPMMNFAYLIGDDGAKIAAAVDPGWDAEKIAGAAEAAGWKIEKILLTHAHFDHAQALARLKELTKAEVYLHRKETEDVSKTSGINFTEDGTVIEIGGVKVTCLHTPGHTPGSQCFLADGAIITGDTLFVDGCGRVDLPGSSPKDMVASLNRLGKLPPSTIVYPGHNYGGSPTSTIGEQLESNPLLRAKSEQMLL